MVNRSKAKGTSGESAVVAWLKARGWADARRVALAGTDDRGDVHAGPVRAPVVMEVKSYAGAPAEGRPGPAQLAGWMDEATREARRAGSPAPGILVVKRAGCGTANVGRWWAFVPLNALVPNASDEPVRLELDALLDEYARRGLM